MTTRAILMSAVVLAAILVVGCGSSGGSGITASDPSGGATEPAGDGATDTPSSEAPATDAPVATSDPETEPGAGSADVCGLVTVAEMEGLFGVSGVTQGFFPGPPDTCDYQLDGAPFVAIVLTPFAAGPVFDAMAADAASELVSGIGDRALYNSQMLTFIVQKGESLLTMQALDESRTEDERRDLMEEIARIAAGRM